MGQFIQYELWKDCKNGCTFCFNKGLPDLDKIVSLNQVMELVDLPEVDEYDEIGFIGGEFFDGQLNNPKVKDLFYRLFDKVVEKINTGKINKLYVTCEMILDNLDDLKEFLEYLKNNDVLEKTLLCTSFDTIGRFHTPERESLWKANMLYIKKLYPKLKLHTEIIMTQDFIEKVLSGEFDIPAFEKTYNTSIDYLEPNTGSYYKDKADFNKAVPNFLVKRNDFLKFLKKTCIDEKTIQLFKLFSKEIRSNTIYLILNGNRVKIDSRRKSARTKGMECLPIIPKFGYIDSDIDIADDVKQLRDMYGE